MVEVDRTTFETFVAEALASLPSEFADHMDNVAVFVEDGAPGGPLLGLYEGHPLTARTLGYMGPPDRVTIYRLPICSRCADEAAVAAQVRRTVIHEVGHHFGISDERLRELGW